MWDRKLVVNDAESAQVRRIFERFVELGSATVLARELRRDGFGMSKDSADSIDR